MWDRYIFRMKKLKSLLVLVFLLAAQQGYSAHRISELIYPIQNDHEAALSFEVNDFTPGIFGEIPTGQIIVSFTPESTKSHPGNSNSKEIQSGLTYSIIKTNLTYSVMQSTVFTRQCTVFIPIYLHKTSFLI